jgi:predicted O-methyltransferase YrrM
VATGTEHFRPQVYDYVVAHTTPPDPLLAGLIEETARRFPDHAGLQIGPEQGTFMTFLAGLVRPRQAVELGTFTGYSAICLARGLADGGRLTCYDVSAEWTALAREYWQRAGLADRIGLRLGPALDSLRALPREASLELAFIDADKTGYLGYWEEIVPRMRPGGLILVDNTLYHGRIFEPEPEANARAIREFNDHAAADSRVEQVMLPVGDGLLIARRR